MKPKLLVILQCPWRKGRLKNGWNSQIWLGELWKSRTGTRLREALPQEIFEVKICNANPSLADSPDGIFPADLAHLRRVIRRIRPNLILACGSVAQKATEEISLGVPVVAMKHPAYRLLSRQMTAEIKSQLVQLAVEMFVRS
jgi:uracil-DNA glycosylase